MYEAILRKLGGHLISLSVPIMVVSDFIVVVFLRFDLPAKTRKWLADCNVNSASSMDASLGVPVHSNLSVRVSAGLGTSAV